MRKEYDEEKMIKRRMIKYGIIGTLSALLLCSGVLMYAGGFGVFYTKTVGRAHKNADREVVKEALAYNEQADQFLAKSYKEYNDAKDIAEKNSIKEYVAMKYPNLDTSKIDNDKLKSFYLSCIG